MEEAAPGDRAQSEETDSGRSDKDVDSGSGNSEDDGATAWSNGESKRSNEDTPADDASTEDVPRFPARWCGAGA